MNAIHSSSPRSGVSRWIWIAVLGLLAAGFGLRMVDLTDEPLDFHSTRQLRGAIIARGMYYQMQPNADPFTRAQAQAFWDSTGQYEPSILERLVALTYLAAGGEYNWIAKIYNALFWIIGGLALFALALRLSTAGPALISLGYYLLLPFGVQATRTFQPDPGMVMWIILTILALHRWAEVQTWRRAVLAGLLGGIAILTKALAIYIIAGAAIALVLDSLGWRRFWRNRQIWTMAALMLAPTLLYYATRGSRATEYFSTWTVALSKLLLDPGLYARWFHLVEDLMGLAVVLLALLGVILARGRARALLLGLWIGYLVYGLFVPYQMYTHNYYHLQLIPVIALSLLSMLEPVTQRLAASHPGWRLAAAGLGIVAIGYLSFLTGYQFILDDYRHEPAYWAEVASYLPEDGKILGLTQDYGYRLMYYGWRKVVLWPPTGEKKLAQLRGSEKEFDEYFAKRIADKSYFVITAFNQFDQQPVLKETLFDRYPVVAENVGYLIFDLENPRPQ